MARRNLCAAASRASGLAAKWHWLLYDEAQDAVFCFICVLSQWYTYVLIWLAVAIALAYVLMYYYGNIQLASSEEI